MRTRTIAVAAIAASAALAVAAGTVATAGSSIDARAGVSGFKEVPAVSTAAGGSFTADIRGDTVHYRLRYGGLEGGDVLFAHVHFGRPATNGGVIAFLCGGGDKPACPESGTVTGVIDEEDVIGPSDQGIEAGEFSELVRAIRRHATYVNVHTDAFPNGEVRGNVIPT